MALGLKVPRIEMVEKWVREGFGEDPKQVYLGVWDGDGGDRGDDERGELVAGALWRFEDGVVANKGREGDGEGEKEGGEDGGKMDEDAKKAAAFADARKRMWEEFEAGFFAGVPYASKLRVLCIFNSGLVLDCLLAGLFSTTLSAIGPRESPLSDTDTTTSRPHDSCHDSRPSPSRSCFAIGRMGNSTFRRTWPQVRVDGLGGWARSVSEAWVQSCSGGGDGSKALWGGGHGVEALDG